MSMEEKEGVAQDSPPEQVEATEEVTPEAPPVSEDVKTPEAPAPEEKAEEKTVPYERFQEVNSEKAALEGKLNELINKPVEPASGESPALDVEDYIDISASLEGLDQREKEKLASDHKLTGKSLKEIRESEDYSLWQSAYRDKVEKEKALNPTTKQSEADAPSTLEQKLAGATIEEKEKLLTEAGLYDSPQPKAHIKKIDG